jgi:hypothetical protein
VRAGDTFRFTDPRLEPHLWMLLSDSSPQTVVVIVSASTKNLGLDLPVIEAGEHPSLGQRSFVRCDKARLVAASLLEENLRRGTIRVLHPLTSALLARIIGAVRASQHTPTEVAAALALEPSP